MAKRHKEVKLDIWKILAIILAILLIISICTSGFRTLKKVSADEAAEKAIGYINQNLLQKGAQASVISVKDTGDMYNIQLQIDTRTYNAFVTKDGKILCPSAIPLN